MKDSTLLRLFFISIGLPLTCASSSSTSSSSTSSTLTTKSKSKTPSLLVDTTNTALDVQLKDQSSLVQSIPEESQVSGGDEQTRGFKELINKGQYEKMSDEELLKHLCQVETTLDQFKSCYEHLGQRKMVPDFLAHGDMALVKKVIAETDLLGTGYFGGCDDIYDAIALSLKGDRYERVAGLFEAAQERPGDKQMFVGFVSNFFARCPLEKNIMPLKRFLTLHGEELSKKNSIVLEAICISLTPRLTRQLDNQASQKLLIDLVGQPYLLTPAAFAWKFLEFHDETIYANFFKYGYREAIEEGLKVEYRGACENLWEAIVVEYPNQFPRKYPRTDEARTAALENFKPTKQDREEEWAKKHAPIFLPKLKAKLQEDDMSTLLPAVLWDIIVEYAETGATWIDV